MTRPWHLEKTDFHARLTKTDLALFRKVCPPQQHEKGRHIFCLGDSASSLYIIDEGQVKLVKPTLGGKARILAICGPGDFIGEAFLSTTSHYQADAVALSSVVACAMNRNQFLDVAARSATFALVFSEVLADHLAHCRNLLSASFDPVKLRLVRALLDQAQHFGIPLREPGWVRLDTDLTHEDIAALVTATRVSVSKALAELQQEGAIRGGRGRYRLNVPALETYLEAS